MTHACPYYNDDCPKCKKPQDPIQQKLTPAPIPGRDDTAKPPIPPKVKTFKDYIYAEGEDRSVTFSYNALGKMLNQHAHHIADIDDVMRGEFEIQRKRIADLHKEVQELREIAKKLMDKYKDMHEYAMNIDEVVEELRGRVGKLENYYSASENVKHASSKPSPKIE